MMPGEARAVIALASLIAVLYGALWLFSHSSLNL